MGKEKWRAGNMLYPVPAVMVSCQRPGEKANIITLAWAGTICSDPAMLSISIRRERYSYDIIKETGEFVVNLVTTRLTKACDWCGVRSGRDFDKFKEMELTEYKSDFMDIPAISESPVNIYCKVKKIEELGTHDMFIAEVLGVTVDDSFMDGNGRFDLDAADLMAYSHGEYFSLGQKLGKFGYSVKKDASKAKGNIGKTDDKKLCVLFPGIGYTNDKPLLYYAGKHYRNLGYKVINVSYDKLPDKIAGDKDRMKKTFDIALKSAERNLSKINWKKYDEVIFVGKSIGTIVSAAYLKRLENGNKGKGKVIKNIHFIYFTPLAETFKYAKTGSGIAFHGTSDPWVETSIVENECTRLNIPLHKYDGANHSLETGNLMADIRIQEDVISKL